jgi:hypothetical protein
MDYLEGNHSQERYFQVYYKSAMWKQVQKQILAFNANTDSKRLIMHCPVSVVKSIVKEPKKKQNIFKVIF